MTTTALDDLCINTVRFLAVDAVQQANSGHPGTPMGAAPMAFVLWVNRDTPAGKRRGQLMRYERSGLRT